MTIKTVFQTTEQHGTAAERAAIQTADIAEGHVLVFRETDTGNEYRWAGAWVQTRSGGAAHVTTAGSPKTTITPTIKTNGGGTSATGSSVTINSGASAGAQHLQASGDAEADVLQELVRFEFDSADEVVVAYLGLSIVPSETTEVQALKFVINGDLVADASDLFGESGVSWVYANEVVEIKLGGTAITSIGVIATSSGVASSVATGAKITCSGYGEAA